MATAGSLHQYPKPSVCVTVVSLFAGRQWDAKNEYTCYNGTALQQGGVVRRGMHYPIKSVVTVVRSETQGKGREEQRHGRASKQRHT